MGDSPVIDPAVEGETALAKVVDSAWQDQALWSAVASRLGDSIKRWRFWSAAAGGIGLFLTVSAGMISSEALRDQRTAMTTMGVLLLAIVPYLRQKLISPERVLAWTKSREASERLKEVIYRFLMGALETDPGTDNPQPVDGRQPLDLIRRCQAIKQATSEAAGVAAAINMHQPELRARRVRMSVDEYLNERVDGQITYYMKSGEKAAKRYRFFYALEIGLGILAVLLGALSGKDTPAMPAGAAQGALTIAFLVPLLTLVMAAAAAVTAHMAASRDGELAARYFATRNALKAIRDEWSVSPDPHDPASVRRLTDAVERAIAAEYGGWVSDWNQAQQKIAQA
jgi:hypothetical protein